MNGRFAVVPILVLKNKKISATEKLFYSVLSSLSAENGYAYATNDYLAEMFGVTERAVQKWIQHLEGVGFLRVERSQGHGRKLFVVADLVGESASLTSSEAGDSSDTAREVAEAEVHPNGGFFADAQNDNKGEQPFAEGEQPFVADEQPFTHNNKTNNIINNKNIYNTAAATGMCARDGVCVDTARELAEEQEFLEGDSSTTLRSAQNDSKNSFSCTEEGDQRAPLVKSISKKTFCERGGTEQKESKAPQGGLRWNRSCPDEDFGEVMRVYHEEIGLPSTAIAFEIEEWLKKVDKSLILYAIKQAVFANSRRYNYINGVLRGEYGNGARTASDVVSRRSGSGAGSPKAEVIRRERAVQIGSLASDLTEKQRAAEEILRRFKERKRNE